MKYFIFANIILLSALTIFYWLPESRELNAAWEALQLQRRRLDVIEADYQMSDAYQAEIEAIQSETTGQPIKLLPYSEIINLLADLHAISQRMGLTETAFLLEEPVLYDTGAGQAAVVNGKVSYSGEYGSLCEMADCWLNASCQTEAITVDKDSGRVEIIFFICGIYE
jgi:hypothetical protein